MFTIFRPISSSLLLFNNAFANSPIGSDHYRIHSAIGRISPIIDDFLYILQELLFVARCYIVFSHTRVTKKGHPHLTGEQAGDETYEGGTTTINSYIRGMKDVRITAVRKVLHQDLVAKYENPIELACGGGNFFDGWMKNPHSALLSCNDGFRPVSFLLETVE